VLHEQDMIHVISGVRHEVAENCAVLGYYASSSGNFLPTFRDNLLVQSSVLKNAKQMILEPRGWDV
jgi:hypothetical protein